MVVKTKEVNFISDGIIEVDGEFYVDQESYNDVWDVYMDLVIQSSIMYKKLIELGVDVEKLVLK